MFLYGCSSCPPIDRTENTLIVHDSVFVPVKGDTVFDTVIVRDGNGESVRYIVTVKHDTVLIKGKDRIVTIARTDTVKIVQYRERERSLFDEIIEWITLERAFGIVVIVVILSIIGYAIRFFQRMFGEK